ncbi:uncharacterized protein VP01_3253g2 [Puccinia sorghi]|uniref:SANT domain-containing protein n=1 Tax=Puccinia sorghi TaxID=27349 RepID=A0A0L6UZW6_9BASI|nr:uncharacterized protein VP01_3253g2 [Puccinia sorghi]
MIKKPDLRGGLKLSKKELLLIEACQIYGLGIWSDITDHVGNGQTKEEAKRQYLDVFICSNDSPPRL